MIKQKFRNIVKLEKDERKTSELMLNDLFFNVFFEQIKLSLNFD